MSTLPSTKTSTAHVQGDTCNCLKVPSNWPCISLPLLVRFSDPLTTTCIPPGLEIRKSLSFCMPTGLYIQLFLPALVTCTVIVCLCVHSACWAGNAQMFHEGEDICTNVYNCTGFAWRGCLTSTAVPFWCFHERMKDPKVCKSTWDQSHLTNSISFKLKNQQFNLFEVIVELTYMKCAKIYASRSLVHYSEEWKKQNYPECSSIRGLVCPFSITIYLHVDYFEEWHHSLLWGEGCWAFVMLFLLYLPFLLGKTYIT